MAKLKIDDIEMEDDWEEENIYSEKSRTLMLDDDEISPEEEGFMLGYEEAC